FYVLIGTSDKFIFQTAERGLSETTQDLREGGSELPTLGWNFRPSQKQLAEDLLSDEIGHFRWGSELPTPTELFRFCTLACVVSRNGLKVSFLDTIASPDRSFAFLLIVRCF